MSAPEIAIVSLKRFRYQFWWLLLQHWTYGRASGFQLNPVNTDADVWQESKYESM